ncbi:MAG: hypothetical protein NZ853_04270 [Leptospiraceae bacterium]|nr:hypothetical protein [Leptospiraceae bacterium]MDW7975389.1 hypothetical protein [Leptospiraceae bacterium]
MHSFFKDSQLDCEIEYKIQNQSKKRNCVLELKVKKIIVREVARNSFLEIRPYGQSSILLYIKNSEFNIEKNFQLTKDRTFSHKKRLIYYYQDEGRKKFLQMDIEKHYIILILEFGKFIIKTKS